MQSGCARSVKGRRYSFLFCCLLCFYPDFFSLCHACQICTSIFFSSCMPTGNFNGQITMSWGQHCKRKIIFYSSDVLTGRARSSPRIDILSPACTPGSQKQIFYTDMITQNYKLVINVVRTLAGATGRTW